MKRSKNPSLNIISPHLFQKKGIRIAYFPKNNLFCEISEIAYEILRSDNWKNKKADEFYKHCNHREEKECLNEINDLKRKGFFNPERNTRQEASIKPRFNYYQPSGIVLDIAQKCNFSCKYCYGADGSYGSMIPFMSKEIAKAASFHLIKTSKDVKKFQVVFFGGEPFLNFSLIKYVVGICKDLEKKEKKKFRFSVTTNASIVTCIIHKHDFFLPGFYTRCIEIRDMYRKFKGHVTDFKKIGTCPEFPVTCPLILSSHMNNSG